LTSPDPVHNNCSPPQTLPRVGGLLCRTCEWSHAYNPVDLPLFPGQGQQME